jgi:hypothetical protein
MPINTGLSQEAPFTKILSDRPRQKFDMDVQIPDGLQPGQQIAVPLPSGQQVMVSMPAGAVAGAMFKLNTIDVQVPDGASPGQTMTVPLPGNRQMAVEIPAGTMQGAVFQVSRLQVQQLNQIYTISDTVCHFDPNHQVHVPDFGSSILQPPSRKIRVSVSVPTLPATSQPSIGCCRRQSFEEHFAGFKNRDMLRSFAAKLGVSESSRLFKYFVHALEINPLLSIFFHDEHGNFDTIEHIASFVGFCAVSMAITFMMLASNASGDAEYHCYHTGSTGCGGFAEGGSTALSMCNTFLGNSDGTANMELFHAFDNGTCTTEVVESCYKWLASLKVVGSCAGKNNLGEYVNPTMADAQSCIGPGSNSWVSFIAWGVIATFLQFCFANWFVQGLLKLRTKCCNFVAYIIIALQIMFLAVFSAAFYDETDCKMFSDPFDKRALAWTYNFGILALQLVVYAPLIGVLSSWVKDDTLACCFHCCCPCVGRSRAGARANSDAGLAMASAAATNPTTTGSSAVVQGSSASAAI